MNIAERLIELRKSKNITTNKLANSAGISQSYLREIEHGNKNPTVEILYYLCEALGVSLSEFFSDKKNDINPILLSSIEKLNDREQILLAELINEVKKQSRIGC